MLSGFAIRHPGQRRVPLLVNHKKTESYSKCSPFTPVVSAFLCDVS